MPRTRRRDLGIISLLYAVVIACTVLGRIGKAAEVIPLVIGKQHDDSIKANQPKHYILKNSTVPTVAETVVIRVTRNTAFEDESEFLRLCMSVNKTPVDCKNMEENFEIWVDYTSLDPHSLMTPMAFLWGSTFFTNRMRATMGLLSPRRMTR